MNIGNLLVIGYGNTLRRDDGVGVKVAEAVEALNLPGVRVITCHQLGPELTQDVSEAAEVIFVDASVAPPNPVLRPVGPAYCSPGQSESASDALGKPPPFSSPSPPSAGERAGVRGQPHEIKFCEIDPGQNGQVLGHACNPAWLLALAKQLHGRLPRAWLLAIPVTDLGTGEGLSATAQRYLEEAVGMIQSLYGGSKTDRRDPVLVGDQPLVPTVGVSA